MSYTYDVVTATFEGLPTETTVTDDWTLLVLDNGNRILSIGAKRRAGAEVFIINAKGEELYTWDHLEWKNEPESVMGAIMRAAGDVSA